MYIRTPQALVWIEYPLKHPQPSPQTEPAERTPYKERWAKKPLDIARGRCVAVRQNAGELELGCMVNNRLIWLSDLHQVLSERQFQNWLREGF